MLSKLILGATLAIGSLAFNANAAVSAEQCEFSKEQVEVLRYAYNRGKEHDLSWTLAAIAWQESSAGVKLKNPKADSYGIFGNLLTTVEARLKDQEFANNLSRVPLNRKQTVLLLQHDWEFASEFAIAELEYWKRRHNGNYRKAVASYFGGNNPNSKAAQRYADTLNSKIIYLKKSGCL
ncbi:hypothetical protein AVV44_gp029 [Cronobacter phage S13]|uniref:Transglycosylase SLT domain-containing protein n=1 Tax=Cronobacter phage LPCS28 TaxID=2924885 RepID=A0AAE9GD37_9CAUD|nr:hypothetical protein AVV44_gp029 [Cronobacter phage S13]YP_010665880.1 unknown function [Cronobacter phage LPCS28]AIA64828.1 hypothetical protein S13_029 [Cronobacter phage S13]UNY47069.1 hypothetical protein EHEKIMEA_00187 [Cronobacter phage LPCS28]